MHCAGSQEEDSVTTFRRTLQECIGLWRVGLGKQESPDLAQAGLCDALG